MSSATTTEPSSVALDSGISKIYRRVVPFLAFMFVLSFLDRTNIGYVREYLQADTGLTDAAYAFGAGVFFFGYALFEVPSNMLLYRVGARRWLARIMVTWGLVAACMMFAHTQTTFYVLRFLLGVCEAGFYPGVVYYLTQWVPTKSRASANAVFQCGAPLAFVFGGPITGWLLTASGGWFWAGSQSWQVTFLVEGLAASVVGVIALFYLPDAPRTARWLTPQEAEAVEVALAAENEDKDRHGQASMLRALVDWRVLYLCVVCFTIQVLGYGYNFYVPTVISSLLGRSVGFVVGVVTAVPAIVAVIGLLTIPRYAERIGSRRVVATAVYSCGALGIVATAFLKNPVLAIIALCVAYLGHIVVQPLFWTAVSTFLTGGAAASGIALIGALGNLGGFVGPNIWVWAEKTFGSTEASLLVLGAFAAVGTVLLGITRVVGIDREHEVISAQKAAIQEEASTA